MIMWIELNGRGYSNDMILLYWFQQEKQAALNRKHRFPDITRGLSPVRVLIEEVGTILMFFLVYIDAWGIGL